MLGLTDEQIQARFGHMLDAFDFGAPPHGGIAPGLDRLITYLTDDDNIREVIAFPKAGGGNDPLMDAPSDRGPRRPARPAHRGQVPAQEGREMMIAINLPLEALHQRPSHSG